MSCCSLDLQRLSGQEAKHADDVVHHRRVVDRLQAAVSRLEGRPPGERDSHWVHDLALMRDTLHQHQKQLLRVLAKSKCQQ